MASAHIEVVASASRLGSDVRTLIAYLQDTQDLCDKIKAVCDQVAYGSDWAALALKLGTTSDEAQTVYNLLGSVKTELNGTFVPQFLARLG